MNKSIIKRVLSALFVISLCAALSSCARQAADLPREESRPAAAQAAATTAAEALTSRTTETTVEAPSTTQKPTTAQTTAAPSTQAATKSVGTKVPTVPSTAAATKKPAAATKPTTEKPKTTAKPTEKAGSSITDYEAEALRLTNKARKKAGLKAFGTSAELQRCADIRAKEIKKSFSHNRPNGQSCFSLNPDLIMGENIASGQTTPKEVVDGWMASKSHRENILRERFTLCAVGCYYDKAGDTYYWVQLFA